METDQELQQRHDRIKVEIEKRRKRRDRMKPGGVRDNASRFMGCLEFTRMQIEMELRDRKIWK